MTRVWRVQEMPAAESTIRARSAVTRVWGDGAPVWLLWLLGYHLSVAVWIGMIALAGLDAETGVVMLLYLRLSHDARLRTGQLRTQAELDEAIVEGAAKRIRPKVMT